MKMDFMFKQLFDHPSRKRITMAFLNGLLNRTGRDRIVDVQYENTELPKETVLICTLIIRETKRENHE
ncbi:hypothetical protein AP3564_15165 [Aeribacillus pallidus]|uniref:Uncharacterized protein n=1 Tax=Aeribacillus pallidus TaxID=33936 RepID=A0A223E807_9BACI|nr:hypothetical protein AP3564_15165 [Aeribacillus pallidus]